MFAFDKITYQSVSDISVLKGGFLNSASSRSLLLILTVSRHITLSIFTAVMMAAKSTGDYSVKSKWNSLTVSSFSLFPGE